MIPAITIKSPCILEHTHASCQSQYDKYGGAPLGHYGRVWPPANTKTIKGRQLYFTNIVKQCSKYNPPQDFLIVQKYSRSSDNSELSQHEILVPRNIGYLHMFTSRPKYISYVQEYWLNKYFS